MRADSKEEEWLTTELIQLLLHTGKDARNTAINVLQIELNKDRNKVSKFRLLF